MSEDDTEREHDPSQRKLEEARRKGDVLRSAELAQAAGYGGLLLATLAGGPLLLALAAPLGHLLATPDLLAPSPQSFGPEVFSSVGRALLAGACFILAPGLVVLAVTLAQGGLTVTPSKLAPKASRVSPLSMAKQKFGPAGLVEFAKSVAKAALYGLALWPLLRDAVLPLAYAPVASPRAAVALMAADVPLLLTRVVLISLGLAAFDYLWQRHQFLKRHRMSRKEMLDEYKESEGDPHMKGARRQKAREIAGRRMLADVAKADVVIVNPTHYAVALQWKRGSKRAPVCLAKGVDEMAARIREAAALAGVPIRPDPPAARAIYATVDIGAEIRPEHYRAVAAAVRFAERMRKLARRRK